MLLSTGRFYINVQDDGGDGEAGNRSEVEYRRDDFDVSLLLEILEEILNSVGVLGTPFRYFVFRYDLYEALHLFIRLLLG